MTSQSPRGFPAIPELEGDFELIGELRRSGNVIAYRARDRNADRDVILQVVRAPILTGPEADARIEAEAAKVIALRHPHVIPLYEVRLLSDGGVALVSGYLPGLSLAEAIQRGGVVPMPFARKLLIDVARALDHAHTGHGIVHRQVKPENIRLDPGLTRALLTGFDILGPGVDGTDLSLVGASPAYMSPEQLDAGDVDHRSDLYSLGLVAYTMLTGRAPWQGESFYNVVVKQRTEPLPGLPNLRAELPGDLSRILESLLQKDPAARIPDAALLIEALEGKGGAIPSAPPGVPKSLPDEHAPEEGAPEWVPPKPPSRSEELAPLDLPTGAARKGAARRRGAPEFQPVAPPPPPSIRRWRVIGAAALLLLTLGVGVVWFVGAGEGWALRGGNSFEFSDADFDDEWDMEPRPGEGSSPPSGPPVRLVAASGDGQVAAPGDMLPDALVVRVEDEEGSPVSGVRVRFEVEGGGASAIPSEALTGALGEASTQVLLGPAPGPTVVTARFEQDGEEVALSFRVSASAGPGAASLASLVQPGREARPATEVPGGVAVRANDAAGRPVAGVEVRFQATGGGIVDPPVAVTGNDGVARAGWLLGPTPGEQRVTVQASGAPSVTLTARATVAVLDTRPMVAVGGTHSCRLSADGNVACWGGNASGQVGGGGLGGTAGPTLVAGPFVFARVAAGVSHTCAVDREGRVLCWGDGSQGQLGAGTMERRAIPMEVADERTFTAVTAGLQHSCALATGGQAFCWGGNGRGQLGDGSTASRDRPTAVAGGRSYTRIAAGWEHGCALTSGGGVYCWGANDHGQAGPSAGAGSPVPLLVPADGTYSEVAAGAGHSCALTRGGEAFCWGDNRSGQLGDDGPVSSSTPLRVRTAERFVAIAAGATHSCGLTSAGAAFCWGRNQFGQLGDGSASDSPIPVPVGGGLRFTGLDATGSHTCGRTDTGVTWCWGYNVEGQLGDGSRTHRSTPVRSASP